MKTKLTASLLLFAIIAVYLFIGSLSKEVTTVTPLNELTRQPSPGGDDEFLIGVMDSRNGQYADSLGLNLWHIYLGRDQNNMLDGWTPEGATDDHLLSAIDTYRTQVRNILYNTYNNHNGRKSLLSRPKIEWLICGKRSDYQCEDTSHITNGLWYYSFQSPGHVGQDIPDSGQYVRYCRPSNSTNQGNWVDNAGMVVSRLRANTEQCRREDDWWGDNYFPWLVKPRIRIDSAFANNPSNLNTPVCSLTVRNQDSVVIKTAIIRVRNFKPDPDSIYHGNYIEEFFFTGNDSNLTIHGAWGRDWAFNARGNHLNDNNNNKADIQVYWYGSCDTWIDYVRVDNEIADGLFNPNNPNYNTFHDWLEWEGNDIASHLSGNASFKFYTELFRFNQIPCMAYVSRKLDSISYANTGKHINLIADQLVYYQYHMAWDDRGTTVSAEQIKRDYIDKVGSTHVFAGDPYPVTAANPDGCDTNHFAQFSRIPETLPIFSGDYVLAVAKPPAEYDAWLQKQFDTVCSFYEGGDYNEWNPNPLTGVFMYLMKHGNAVSKLCDIPFIAMLQAHQWISGGEVDREPTNEELDVMTNIAVSYGAKGITYFWYYSFDNGVCNHSLGITEGGQPRYTNVYGQPKWEKMKAITKRLKGWGPILMSFDNTQTNSYIYRYENERNLFLNSSYFYEVLTYPSGTNTFELPSAEPDLVNFRYVQTATFRKKNEANSYYFMIVNRRCSPFYASGTSPRFPNGENGGRRFVRIKIDAKAPEFEVSNNWDIINCEDNSVVARFNKQVLSVVGLGWYMPGEGKLYKIVPAP